MCWKSASVLNIHQLLTNLRSQCTSEVPSSLLCLKQNIANLELLICPRAPALSHPAAVLLLHWMSNLLVPFSSQLFLSLSIQPIKILPALSAWQLFLSLHTAELSSKLSVILHLGYCNIISLASAAVVWLGLYLFRILPLKSFVALHLTGNQPTFDSICVISDISCMSICIAYFFSSSETLFKMLDFSCLQKFDCD